MTDQNSLQNMNAAPHLMDKIYRNQRFIYNASRKYYLLGRDELINALTPPDTGLDNSKVLELGCGTGRNLICAAKKYTRTRFYGVDISTEMLKTASQSVASGGHHHRISLAKGDATTFDPLKTFGIEQFDRVFISFTLSMVPAWESVVARAIEATREGGEVHIADFGECKQYPRLFQKALYAWLNLFHVNPIPNLPLKLQQIASETGTELTVKPLYAGYSLHLILKKPNHEAAS